MNIRGGYFEMDNFSMYARDRAGVQSACSTTVSTVGQLSRLSVQAVRASLLESYFDHN